MALATCLSTGEMICTAFRQYLTVQRGRIIVKGWFHRGNGWGVTNVQLVSVVELGVVRGRDHDARHAAVALDREGHQRRRHHALEQPHPEATVEQHGRRRQRERLGGQAQLAPRTMVVPGGRGAHSV
jgi:hypothetical protein